MNKKEKIYAVFMIRPMKNGKSKIEGVCKSYINLNLSTSSVSIGNIDFLEKTLKSAKKNFPKILKKGAKLVPLRLTRDNLSLPIEVNTKSYDGRKKIVSFKKVNKVKQRQFKLSKIL